MWVYVTSYLFTYLRLSIIPTDLWMSVNLVIQVVLRNGKTMTYVDGARGQVTREAPPTTIVSSKRWWRHCSGLCTRLRRNSSLDDIPERDRVPKFGVGALYPLRPRTRQDFICCCWRCLYNLRRECALPCSKDFRDKHEILKVMLGHCAPRSLYHLPGKVISAAVRLVLVYINLQPKYELPSFRFKQFQKFGINKLGTLSFQATSKKTISARGLSSCSWLPVR